MVSDLFIVLILFTSLIINSLSYFQHDLLILQIYSEQFQCHCEKRLRKTTSFIVKNVVMNIENIIIMSSQSEVVKTDSALRY